jgi:hypothetical protein
MYRTPRKNLAAYGRPQGGTRRPFPRTRSVGLRECGTHAVVAAAELGTIYQGEHELADKPRDRVSGDMLIIDDRGFYSYDLWHLIMLANKAVTVVRQRVTRECLGRSRS